jgi:putative endonuclease
MGNNIDLGNLGEQLACDYLSDKGFTIDDRNYRYRKGEIDIVARKERLMVFVEVKTRTNVSFGEPEQAVQAAKVKLILAAAEMYVQQVNWLHDIRFDIIAIHYKDQPEIIHFEDAFY